LIDQRAPGLSVAHAGTAGSATSATDAINATNALNAASANQASNATTANGVTVESLRYHVSPGSPPVVLVSMGGLALTASCDGGDLSLEAETASNNATLNSISFSTIDGSFANAVHQGDFDTSENPQELAAVHAGQVLTTHYTRPLSIGIPASAITVQAQLEAPAAGQCR